MASEPSHAGQAPGWDTLHTGSLVSGPRVAIMLVMYNV